MELRGVGSDELPAGREPGGHRPILAEEETETQAEEVASVLVCLLYRRSQGCHIPARLGNYETPGSHRLGAVGQRGGGEGADDCRRKTGGAKQPRSGGKASGVMWSPTPAKQK